MEGAPTLQGYAGGAYTVLKWALPQFGWTIEYDDDVNFKIVFRNNPTTGTGTYLEVVDNEPYGASYPYVCSFRLYQTMTGIETGTGRTPDADHGVGSYPASWIRQQSSSYNDHELTYRFIGTDRGFHLLCRDSNHPSAAHIWQWGWFGDLVPYEAGDNPFLMQPPTYDDYYYTSFGPEIRTFASYTDAVRGARYPVSKADGVSHDARVFYLGDLPTARSRALEYPGAGNYATAPGKSEMYFIKPLACEVTDDGSYDRTYERGYIPGTYFPQGNWIEHFGLDVPVTAGDGVETFTGVEVGDAEVDLNLYGCGAFHGSYIYGMLLDEESPWYE
jgi:hypothetical protein